MATLLYSKRIIKYSTPRRDRIRPRTFKTEEKAKAHAGLKGFKDYKILPKGKKFIILQKS